MSFVEHTMMQADAENAIATEELLFPGDTADIKPLLKWAGGKSRLVPALLSLLPAHFNRYVEPFFGGGALFWSLARPDSLISDCNPELINFYTIVRDQPAALIREIHTLRITRADFYRIRSLRSETLSPLARAARFIYLNKTCYNGLHRVNRQGQFNTPFGGRLNVRIVDEENLLRASTLLRSTTIYCNDFTELLTTLQEGDFVYLDPPYMPVGKYSDFRRYTKDIFNEEHHIRLAIEFRKLAERGVKALLSNSANERIRLLYRDFPSITVKVSRFINCRATGRGPVSELLVATYPLEPVNVLP